MKFINTKTGAIIESDSLLCGVWEKYEPSKQAKEKPVIKKEVIKPKEKKEVKKENSLTVKEIKQELEAFGVDYDNKATKSELLKILEDFKIKE